MIRHGLLLMSLLALSACGGGEDDLDQFINEVKSRTSKAIEPLPQIKQYQAFSFEPGERRDPFEANLISRAQRAAAAAGGVQPDFNRNKEPLEEFPLDSLRMVGTIEIRKQSYALIKAPDAVIHRVAIGDHLGQNYGKVTKVTEAEIELSEIVPDPFGGWKQRPATLGLAE
ncbi:MAG: pilus assembly protein PilP [Pseudomonadota bacterium]